MKILLLLIFTTLSSIACIGQKQKNDLTTDNLYGKVKSLIETSYKAEVISGKIEKGNRKRNISTIKDFHKQYDIKGNLIEKRNYNSDGSLSYKIVTSYTYDDLGNVTEKTFSDTGNFVEISTINSKGVEIKKTEIDSTTSFSRKIIFKYDSEGNNVEVNYLDKNGKVNSSIISTYSKFGTINVEKSYSYGYFNTILDLIDEYKYNELGKITERVLQFADKDNNKKFSYIYDESGNQLKSYFIDKFKYVETYDKNENKIELRIYNPDASILATETLKYDIKNNVISSIKYNAPNKSTHKDTFKYDYDSKGNWIKKIEFNGEIPTYILYRNFEYF